MKVLTTQQVADRLGVSLPTIHLWIKANMFPNAYQKSPQRKSPWVIPEQDVIAFEAARRHPVSATP